MSNLRRALVWFLVLALLLLALLVGSLAWFSQKAQMGHFNRSNSNTQSLWKVYGGAWQVGNGLVRNNSDDRGAKLLSGSSSWRDYTFVAELRFDGAHGDMGVIVRSDNAEEGADSYDGYYVGLRAVDGMLVAGRSDFGWIETRPVPMPGGIHASAWYRIVVTAVGCHLAASSENLSTGQRAYIAVRDDNCLEHGQIGLRSFATGGIWRNIQVQPAVLADYQQLAVHAGNLRALELPKREADYNRDYHFSSADPSTPQLPQEETKSASELVHIADVSNYPRGAIYPVRLRGVVTLTAPALYVQDSDGAIVVRTNSPMVLNLGDVVEVTGQAVQKRFGNEVHASSIRLLWSGASVPPIAVTAAQAASGAFDAKFIETEAQLVAQSTDSAGNVVLELTDGSQDFRALMSAQMAHSMPAFDVNSLLRVRGICVLNREMTHDLAPFVLLPRSANDVQVLASAPWWTPWHVGLLIVALVGLVVVVQMAYYRVDQWRANAVTKERERLAHEIHDTMAQSFAGVGYQIQGVRSRVLKGERIEQTQIADQLSVAYQLVRRCHEEASRTIAMLGTASPEAQHYLLGMLEATAQRIAGTPIQVETTVEGDVYPLPLRAANALLMIGQEAISNALGHGEATALQLGLKAHDHSVELTIQDNGKGFDTGKKVSGFGIQGMQKRARDMRGQLQISSMPQVGTTICVIAPLERERRLEDFGLNWVASLGQRLRKLFNRD